MSVGHENNGQIFPGIHHIVEIIHGFRVVDVFEIRSCVFILNKNRDLATKDTVNINARITLNDGIGEIVRQSKNCGPKFFDDDVTFGCQFRVVDDFGNQLMDAGFIDDDSILERDEGLLIVP